MSLNTYPYNPFPASTDKLDEAHNAELQQEVDQLKEDTGELQEDIEKLETDKTDTAVIAPEFNAETGVYAVSDLVMYQGKLYEFTTAHETAGDWDPTEVTEKTVADEIDTVKSGLTDLLNNLKVVSVPSGTNRKIKITRSYDKQYFFVMSNNNYHPFFGIISQLDGATDHLQSVPTNSGVTVSLTDNTFEFTLISYFGGLTIISNTDFTVTAEPVT